MNDVIIGRKDSHAAPKPTGCRARDNTKSAYKRSGKTIPQYFPADKLAVLYQLNELSAELPQSRGSLIIEAIEQLLISKGKL